MAKFKIPGVSGIFNEVVGLGAEIIQGGQAKPSKTASNISDIIIEGGLTSVQRPLNKLYDKIERVTGYGIGRPGVGEILNDPSKALGQFLGGRLKIGGGTTAANAWMPLLRNRNDPLWEIDWYCMLPFEFDPAYVEDITWNHPRISEESVFRNGKPVHLANAFEVPSIQVTLYEDNKLYSQTWYNNWKNMIFDEKTGTFAYPAQYKQPIYLLLRDVTQNVVGSITFKGCFPTGSPNLTNSADGQRVKVQLEFAVDSIEFQASAVQNAETASTTLVQTLKDGLAGNLTGVLKNFSGGISSAVSKGRAFLSSAFSSFSRR